MLLRTDVQHEAAAWLEADEYHRRGEFVLVLDPPAAREPDDDGAARRVLALLLEELPVKQAAQVEKPDALA